jgi:dihydrofolate reductase
VLSHRPLGEGAPEGVETYSGDIAPLVGALKRDATGDIWLLGGASVAQDFLERDLVDRLELYLIPILLGEGVRLFGPSGQTRTLAFSEAKSFPNGIIGLFYELSPHLRLA